MAKRNASTDLNHDNWDAVEEKEEAGRFVPLSSEKLQNRVIKRAKRTLNTSSSANNSTAGTSPFASFSGFASSSASSPFQKSGTTNNPLFSSTIKKEVDNTNGKTTESKKLESFDNSDSAKQQLSSNSLSQPKQARSIEYYRQLQSLNESVLKWMQLHLEKNACSDFTPVFTDYRKHLDTLNVTYPVQKKESVSLSSESVFKQPVDVLNKNDIPSFKKETPTIKNEKNKDDTDYGAHFKSNTTNTASFSFGMKVSPSATSSGSSIGPTSSSKEETNQNKSPEVKAPAQFSFGDFSKTNATNAAKPFSFGAENNIQSPGFFSKAFQPSEKPLSFATAPIGNSASETKPDNEGEEYVPPKNDFVAISEEDAFYSKRCKLFFKKKGDDFTEKGVGTLYLKSLEGKTQLLIRADTNLGNILLNIMMNPSLPMSVAKNNVLLSCIPNPPLDVKNPDSKEAVSVLIRVKTVQDAEELLENLQKSQS